eukprot:CAMPEP_0196581474 /NCGR_PEP_ID=MMETSP1081-20130531/33982_1 /TAXON_ID=36882 /ORGANISM="Pyramimonas amylifera, Strain CCMP720" /LENGTH=230 /DNA_ID=CAMNT_0041901715 /DNA_START=108 /DNA_END=800 /DNA_ORIENTATION=-
MSIPEGGELQGMDPKEAMIRTSMEDLQEFKNGTQTRLNRCREMMGRLAHNPKEINEELTSELDAMLWMRLGAPPVYHLDEAGMLKPDPFAPAGKLYPAPTSIPRLQVPDEPVTWRTSSVNANKDRRQAIIEERRQQTTAMLEEMMREQEEEFLKSRGYDESSAASVRSTRSSASGQDTDRSERLPRLGRSRTNSAASSAGSSSGGKSSRSRSGSIRNSVRKKRRSTIKPH